MHYFLVIILFRIVCIFYNMLIYNIIIIQTKKNNIIVTNISSAINLVCCRTYTTIICSCHINILSILCVLFFVDSNFPYLHPLEELANGVALIHPLDIHQRGMHGFLGFLNWNSLVAFFLIDD